MFRWARVFHSVTLSLHMLPKWSRGQIQWGLMWMERQIQGRNIQNKRAFPVYPKNLWKSERTNVSAVWSQEGVSERSRSIVGDAVNEVSKWRTWHDNPWYSENPRFISFKYILVEFLKKNGTHWKQRRLSMIYRLLDLYTTIQLWS